MPAHPDPAADPHKSKRIYVKGRLQRTDVDELAAMARRFLEDFDDPNLADLLQRFGRKNRQHLTARLASRPRVTPLGDSAFYSGVKPPCIKGKFWSVFGVFRGACSRRAGCPKVLQTNKQQMEPCIRRESKPLSCRDCGWNMWG